MTNTSKQLTQAEKDAISAAFSDSTEDQLELIYFSDSSITSACMVEGVVTGPYYCLIIEGSTYPVFLMADELRAMLRNIEKSERVTNDENQQRVKK
jgi:hypothetical protein